MNNLGPFLGNPNEIYMGRFAAEEPLINRGNNVGNVLLKETPSRLTKAKTALKDTASAIKNRVGNIPLKSIGGAATGLAAIDTIANLSANNHASRPEVQADWETFKTSDYINFIPAIHDEDYSEDMKQAIMQMAPAANALNLRKNHLELLNGLANVAEEERALQNATQDLLANNAATDIVNDSRDPGTQAYLAQQAKNNTSTGNGNGSSVTGSKNALDSLMGLLGLLALGGGAYYLGKKL